MIDHIITVLKASPGLTQYVPADNIYPLFRLQGASLPAITIQLTDTQPVYTHDMQSDVDMHRFELTIFFEGVRNAFKAGHAVRLVFDHWDGDNSGIDQVRLVGQASDIFEVQDAFSLTQTYECHQNR